MASVVQDDKTTATAATDDKHISPVSQFLQSGKVPSLQELADYTFESVVLQDGTHLKDITFQELSNVVWEQDVKH